MFVQSLLTDYAYLVLGTRCVIRVNELYRDLKEVQIVVVNSRESGAGVRYPLQSSGSAQSRTEGCEGAEQALGLMRAVRSVRCRSEA